MSIDLLRTQNPIGGGGFLSDSFLELNTGVTTPAIPKSIKVNSSCVSDGALAGAIIGTLIMSAFIGFLTWLIYIRPKFQELQYRYLHETRRIPDIQHHTVPTSISNHKQQNRTIDDDPPQLPLDVTDYKFGTFPFRQSQTSSANGHYNRTDWLNRISSSFRSVNMDQDAEMIDIELLEPTFGGLNFSITGNMRAGIFVKEILDKGQVKLNSSNQLKSGDRIMALTVCFESIVYEDALTILSYASPYPVILRVQRSANRTKVHVTTEKRSTTANSSNKVKWRDDFEHYDNDTPVNRSFIQPNPPPVTTNPLPPIPMNSKTPSSPQIRSSSKKTRSDATAQPRRTTKSSSTNKDLKNSEAAMMPYYDSPYDYYYGGQVSQYQYLHQSHLNKNNNNSLSTESLTAVTPNLATSVYTLQLSSIKSSLPIPRRCERRLSLPAIITPAAMNERTIINEKSIENIDTFV